MKMKSYLLDVYVRFKSNYVYLFPLLISFLNQFMSFLFAATAAACKQLVNNSCKDQNNSQVQGKNIQQKVLEPVQLVHWGSGCVQSWMPDDVFNPPNSSIQRLVYLIHQNTPQLFCPIKNKPCFRISMYQKLFSINKGRRKL